MRPLKRGVVSAKIGRSDWPADFLFQLGGDDLLAAGMGPQGKVAPGGCPIDGLARKAQDVCRLGPQGKKRGDSAREGLGIGHGMAPPLVGISRARPKGVYGGSMIGTEIGCQSTRGNVMVH
jgi:hypothetical protein